MQAQKLQEPGPNHHFGVSGGAAKSEESVEGQYVRYVSPDGDWAESRVEYDMDDEDEEWLEQYNGQVSIPAMLSKNFGGPIPSSHFPQHLPGVMTAMLLSRLIIRC